MDESFAAYLEQVRRQRAELGESMAALDAALALAGGPGRRCGGAGCGPRSPSSPTTCATTSS